MQQLNLHIKSFDPYYIEKSIKKINHIISLLKISSVIIFSLPKSVKKITLIKSPHIDKKSREQFEIKHYKTILCFNIKKTQNLFLLVYMLKNSEFSGIEMKIFLKYNTYYNKKNFKIKKFV